MKDFELMLAPMEGHTTPEFREICHKNGADSTFTEMARISGLARRNRVTLEKIQIPKPVPTYIQLIGSKPKELEKFLSSFTPPDGFQGFNLNLGCSSPDIIQVGLGSALIKRPGKVNSIIKTIQEFDYPASIKMRLGLNKFEKDKRVYLKLINNVDADFFVVHTRYGKQTLDDFADNRVYKYLVETGKVIIGNGDIQTKEQVKSLKEMGINGVMIGRAALDNPEIFNTLKV